MTHFSIICPAASGHLNPMTTLGSELLDRGHRVTMFNFLDAKATTLASGWEFQPLAEGEFPAGSMAEGLTQLGKLSGITAFRYTIEAFARISTAILTEGTVTLFDRADKLKSHAILD